MGTLDHRHFPRVPSLYLSLFQPVFSTGEEGPGNARGLPAVGSACGQRLALKTTGHGTDPSLTGQTHSQPGMEALGLAIPPFSPKDVTLFPWSLITQPLEELKPQGISQIAQKS